MKLYSTAYAAAICHMTVRGITLWIREGKVPATRVEGGRFRVFTLRQLIAVLDYAVEQAPHRWGKNCGARRNLLVKNRKGFAEMLP